LKYKLNEAESQRLLGMSAEWISGLQSGFVYLHKTIFFKEIKINSNFEILLTKVIEK
jgi:hypothetical protein